MSPCNRVLQPLSFYDISTTAIISISTTAIIIYNISTTAIIIYNISTTAIIINNISTTAIIIYNIVHRYHYYGIKLKTDPGTPLGLESALARNAETKVSAPKPRSTSRKLRHDYDGALDPGSSKAGGLTSAGNPGHPGNRAIDDQAAQVAERG